MKKKKHRPTGDMELQITSMADIFTILLVFLLKSYATSAVEITPTAGVKLPATTNPDSGHIEAMKVEISPSFITLEEQPPIPVTLPQDELMRKIDALMAAARKRQTENAKKSTDVKADSRIILVSDQGVPYKLVRTVLGSAASQGFTDFKLAVVQKE